jgi:hypothetical protein
LSALSVLAQSGRPKKPSSRDLAEAGRVGTGSDGCLTNPAIVTLDAWSGSPPELQRRDVERELRARQGQRS